MTHNEYGYLGMIDRLECVSPILDGHTIEQTGVMESALVALHTRSDAIHGCR